MTNYLQTHVAAAISQANRGGEGHQPASSSSSATESNGSWAAGKSQGMGVLYRIHPEDHGHKRNQQSHFLEEL